MKVLKPLTAALIIAAATAAPTASAHADVVPFTCLGVEVSSSSGDFCVQPTLAPETVPASGSATVTNNTPANVLVSSDTGDAAAILPRGSANLSAFNNVLVQTIGFGG